MKNILLMCLFVLASCGKTDTYQDEKIGPTTPIVSYLSVTQLSENTQSSITLTGKNFSSGMSISVGGQPCTSLTILSSTSATCLAPALPAGTKTVTASSGSKTTTATQSIEVLAPPLVTSLSATHIPQNTSPLLTINGSGFYSSSIVTIDNQQCIINTILPTSISCYVPSLPAGFYSLDVTNSDGQQSNDSITFVAPASVTSLSKNLVSNLTTPGSITITGSNLSNVTTVTVGGASCSNLNIVSSTSITCDLPTLSNGLYSIVVTNSYAQVTTYSSSLRYSIAPTVTSVNTSVSSNTSTTVTFTGTNFTSGMTVLIDNTSCSSVSVSSSTSLTCQAPAKAAGSYDVKVTNSYGSTSTTSALIQYTNNPIVSSVSSTLVSQASPGSITITGSAFTASSISKVNGTNCSTTTYVSATSLTCALPNLSSGLYDVSVTNEFAQTGVLTNAIRYDTYPTVTAFSGGVVDYGTAPTRTITGTGFDSSTSAQINGVACSTTTFVSSTSLTCILPSSWAVGVFDITVTNQFGTIGTGSGLVRVNKVPTITSISPSTISIANSSITLTGTNFESSSTIKVNGLTCTNVNIVSTTSATCDTPTLSDGLYNVVIENQYSQSGTLASSLRFSAPPTVSSFVGGVIDFGTTPTRAITGTGFDSGSIAKINGVDCTTTTYISPTSLTCVLSSSLTEGLFDIVVTNQYGKSGTGSGLVRVHKVPTVTSVSSSLVLQAAPGTITITGTNFTSSSIGYVGGSACLPSTYVSSTSISCALPTLISGLYDVVVTNEYSQSGTLSNAIRYDVAPTVTAFGGGTIDFGTTPTRTITGTGFDSSTTATINGVACSTSTYVSSTSMTCVVPSSLAEGLFSVVVTNQHGTTGTGTSLVRVSKVPTITSISPAIISVANATITLTGTNFKASSTITVNGLTCSSVNIVSTTSATCNTPTLTDGIFDVIITNPYSQTGTKTSGVRFSTSPTVTAISGGTIPSSTTENRTFTGTGFDSATTLTINGTSCITVVILNSTSLTCNVPALTTGTYNVAVTNQYGVSSTTSSLAVYAAVTPAQTITSTNWANIDKAGGESLRINGTNLNYISTVTIGSGSCAITAQSASQITCTTPAQSSSGTYTITTTNSASNVVTTTINAVDYCSDRKIALSPFAGGTGISSDPYTICTATQYAAMGTTTNTSYIYYKLWSDITLTTNYNYRFVDIDLNNFTLTGSITGITQKMSNNIQLRNGIIYNVDSLIFFNGTNAATQGGINFYNTRIHFNNGSFFWLYGYTTTGGINSAGNIAGQTCNYKVNYYLTDLIIPAPRAQASTTEKSFFGGRATNVPLNLQCFERSLIRITEIPTATKAAQGAKTILSGSNSTNGIFALFKDKSIILFDEGNLDTSSDNCNGYYCVTTSITENYNRAWKYFLPVGMTASPGSLSIVLPDWMGPYISTYDTWRVVGETYLSTLTSVVPTGWTGVSPSVTMPNTGTVTPDSGSIIMGNTTGASQRIDWTPTATATSFYDELTGDNTEDSTETFADKFFWGNKTTVAANIATIKSTLLATPPVQRVSSQCSGNFPADCTSFTNGRSMNWKVSNYVQFSDGQGSLYDLRSWYGQFIKPKDYCKVATGTAIMTSCNFSLKIRYQLLPNTGTGYFYARYMPAKDMVFNDIGINIFAETTRNYITYTNFKDVATMENTYGFTYDSTHLKDTHNGYDAPHYSDYPYFYGVSKCAISEISDCSTHP